MSENSSPTTSGRSTAARVALVVTGTLTALIATGLLLGGGVALWADGKKDDAGYLSTSRHEFGARTAALATKDLDIDLDGAQSILDSGDLGKVRLEVASKTRKPIFVGVARTRDVAAYLRDTAHTTLTDLDSHPFKASYVDRGGRHAAAAPPARRDIWAASAQGRGTQTLRWRVRDGSWSVVVMNADGSPAVRADIRAGAKVPYLSAAGWTAIGGGVLAFAAASALLAFGIRPRRTPPPPPAPAQAQVIPAEG
jgi:hypothetical protein